MKKRSFISLAFLLTLFYLPSKSTLANYDCYVSSDYKYHGTGSLKQPFNKLLQATTSNECKSIFVFNGVYDESDIIIRNDVNVVGESVENVVIAKDIKMEGKSSLNNASVITEKYFCRGDVYTVGILVESNANVVINNSVISNAREGVQVKEGAELSMSRSKIINNCKGLYALGNSKINISNSDISNNWGEGIDIRGAVSGEVVENKINDNGECGIELIIGNSDLKITNNNIFNNKASGVTVQFYDKGAGANAKGSIEIKDNIILNNEEYGIGCKRPNGGNPGGSYWSETVKIKQNEMRSNIDGSFSSSCKFSGKTKSEAIKVVNDEDKSQKEFYDFLDKDIERQVAQTAVQNRSKIKTFLIGSDYDQLNELDSVISSYNDYANRLEDISKSNVKYKDVVSENREDVLKVNKEIKKFVNEERGKFNLFGWLFN